MNGGGTAFVMLAALCWGLAGVIAGMLMAEGWNPFVLAVYRGTIGLGIVLVWLAMRRKRSGLADRYLWLWSVIAGLGITGNFAFYFLSIDTGSVAVAATLMYCAPVFVYLTSFALKLERPTLLKCTAILAVMIGVFLLTQVHKVGSSQLSAFSIGTGLLAGVSYALFIFAFKKAAPRGSPQAILLIAFSVLIALLIWPAESWQMTAALHSPKWPLFAILGVIGAGFSFFIYIVGIHHTTPAVASVVAMLEPVIASASAVLILSERLNASQVLGMVLILVTTTGLSAHSAASNETKGNNPIQ